MMKLDRSSDMGRDVTEDVPGSPMAGVGASPPAGSLTQPAVWSLGNMKLPPQLP